MRFTVYPRYKTPRQTADEYYDNSPFMFHEDGTPELVNDEALLAMWETEEQRRRREEERQKIICSFYEVDTNKFHHEREFASITELKAWMAKNDATISPSNERVALSHDDSLLTGEGWVQGGGRPATQADSDFELSEGKDGKTTRRYKESEKR